jgi:Protein of unknown function (DUF1566)
MQSSSKGAYWLCVALFAVGIAIANLTIPLAGQGKQPPAPSSSSNGRCWANGYRYVNCGNGTVTDQVTGLIWLQRADCLGAANWAAANQAVQALKHGDCGLADNSSAGQWGLPTRAEWEATILMPPAPCTFPALTNDYGSACINDGPSSLITVIPDAYWTSSARYSVELPNPEDRMRFAWKANLGTAGMEATSNTDNYRIWPVR